MEPVDWYVIGGLFGLVAGVLGHLYKRTSAFIAFRAMDEEREQHWMKWRDGFEERINEYMNGQALWRHQELMPTLKDMQADLTTIKETVRHLEKMGG